MTPNPAVADRARTIADQAPGGSLTRRVAGCVVVAYSTTRSDAHARKVLGELPEDLRAECVALADTITQQLQDET